MCACVLHYHLASTLTKHNGIPPIHNALILSILLNIPLISLDYSNLIIIFNFIINKLILIIVFSAQVFITNIRWLLALDENDVNAPQQYPTRGVPSLLL
jgi:hypothetical protein